MAEMKSSATDGWRIAEWVAIGLTCLGFVLYFGRMTEQISSMKKEVERIRELEQKIIQIRADLNHTRQAYANHLLHQHQNQMYRNPYSPTRGSDPSQNKNENPP